MKFQNFRKLTEWSFIISDKGELYTVTVPFEDYEFALEAYIVDDDFDGVF